MPKPIKYCSIVGCVNRCYGHGWCNKHYSRWRRNGDPEKVVKVSYIQPATQVPTEFDIAWVAGFLEGEGTFGYYTSTPRVTAPQVQKEPLEKLQALFGGSITLRNNQNIWAWNVYGKTARELMNTMYPHMSTRRREQISQALTKDAT